MRRYVLIGIGVAVLLGILINPKACLFTEPLWGIPYNLFIPFATLYMYALGVKDEQIGMLLTVGMLLQVLSAIFGGIITDKFGRRQITFVVDFISWSVPCIIWMLAQNFWWFLAAAAFNSLLQVTSISWQCLLVEDCDQRQLVNVYTWVNVSGLLAVFFAPLSALFVSNFSLVPTVRMLYGFAFISMSVKFIILYFYSTETEQGKKRMEETKHQSIWSLFVGYKNVLKKLLASRQMMLVLAVFVMINITGIPVNNFFSLYITQNLGIPERYVSIFPIGRAATMLLFTFILQSKINQLKFKPVMLCGFLLYIASHVMLLVARPNSVILVIGYTILEAAAFALVIPRRDSLGAIFIDKDDRARVMSLIFVIMLVLSSPFGTIIGWLSSINRQYPFMLNIVIFVVVAIIVSTSKAVAEQDGDET